MNYLEFTIVFEHLIIKNIVLQFNELNSYVNLLILRLSNQRCRQDFKNLNDGIINRTRVRNRRALLDPINRDLVLRIYLRLMNI